jgi:hypothetical protein
VRRKTCVIVSYECKWHCDVCLMSASGVQVSYAARGGGKESCAAITAFGHLSLYSVD